MFKIAREELNSGLSLCLCFWEKTDVGSSGLGKIPTFDEVVWAFWDEPRSQCGDTGGDCFNGK